MRNTFIHLFIVFITLIIIMGLVIGSQKINIKEYFHPEVSSSSDVESGASQYYNWGDKPEIISLKDNDTEEKEDKYRDGDKNYYNKTIKKNIDNYFIYIDGEKKYINEKEVCNTCDITLNRDIDKYVLKSSIPPYPDLSAFATKNMMGKNINMSDYIHKNEIKPCPQIDLDNYILKSKIPSCDKKHTDECPECPECPKCKPCPHYRGSKIYNYKIVDDPVVRENHEHLDKFKDLTKKCIDKLLQYKERNKKCDDEIKNLNDRIEEYKKKESELEEHNNKLIDENNRKQEDNRKQDDRKHEDKKEQNTIQKIFKFDEKNYKSPILNDTLQGGYTGDSLFAFI